MIRDITIGQYYPADSVIHRLDPRVKLFGTLLFMVSLFTFQGFMPYIIVFLFWGAVIKISKVPFSYMLRGFKSIFLLLIFTTFFNVFFTPGDPLFRIGMIGVTKEGLKLAAFMGLRLGILITGSSIMTFTTTPNHLTDGMETALQPLKKIHLPVHEVSMMMSIALRFIPILLEETDKIMKAQTARGADFETGSFITRAKNLVPLLVPLFVSAFRRANDLAMAMEARCYNGGQGRTKMKPLHYKKRDRIAYGVILVYLCLVIMIGNW